MRWKLKLPSFARSVALDLRFLSPEVQNLGRKFLSRWILWKITKGRYKITLRHCISTGTSHCHRGYKFISVRGDFPDVFSRLYRERRCVRWRSCHLGGRFDDCSANRPSNWNSARVASKGNAVAIEPGVERLAKGERYGGSSEGRLKQELPWRIVQKGKRAGSIEREGTVEG